MKIRPTQLPEVMTIEPDVFGDARGYFMETWNDARYRELGIAGPFVQDNVSLSGRGVLRGLHFQHPNDQGKLVYALQGEIFDVAVDVRRGSPTFGRWAAATLNAENKLQMYIPPGFAHGFCVLSDQALFAYKCSAFYSPEHETAIRWDDPDIGIPWPVAAPRLSAKDQAALRMADVPRERLPVYQSFGGRNTP